MLMLSMPAHVVLLLSSLTLRPAAAQAKIMCLPGGTSSHPCSLAAFRFMIPGMGGREDWGRTEDELMRARGVVDEVLVCMGLAPAHYDENLRARVRACCLQL
jgi:hypothetical protein